ncbi:response regulator [Massilia sp. H-1]|nr:response regulator [Massilia sp. H-1]
MRLLVIDDDPLSQRGLNECAQGLGWHPTVVGSGADALAELNAWGGITCPYDVIVVDGKLPDMAKASKPCAPASASARSKACRSCCWPRLGSASGPGSWLKHPCARHLPVQAGHTRQSGRCRGRSVLAPAGGGQARSAQRARTAMQSTPRCRSCACCWWKIMN